MLRTRILCWLAYGLYRLLTFGYKIRFVGLENRDQAYGMHPNGSFVMGIWHEYFFAAVAAHPNLGIRPMISQSEDGEFIAFIAKKLGYRPVRGSSSRGGAAARQKLYERIERGLIAAFTADGPRGPRRKMKSGLIDLSRSGQMAILPLAVAADRSWVLKKSWDQSLIPKPFANVWIAYGEPIMIPADCHGKEFAAAKRQVTERLNAVDAVAVDAMQRWQKMKSN